MHLLDAKYLRYLKKMIISKDINPQRDLYYLGAKVIEILSSSNDSKFDFFSVYEILKTSEKISVHLFILTLDWLFINGIIDEPEQGSLRRLIGHCYAICKPTLDRCF